MTSTLFPESISNERPPLLPRPQPTKGMLPNQASLQENSPSTEAQESGLETAIQ